MRRWERASVSEMGMTQLAPVCLGLASAPAHVEVGTPATSLGAVRHPLGAAASPLPSSVQGTASELWGIARVGVLSVEFAVGSVALLSPCPIRDS